MMAKSLNLATLVTLAIAATLLGHATAATYIVGDSRGWTFDPDGTIYPTWASRHTFTVGDVLVFNFATGSHTVAEVTKESFDACNTDNPVQLVTTGPANFTIILPGKIHFICTVGQHCSSFSQKLAIIATASSGGNTPKPSTAARTGLASIFNIFISAAVYLLF